MGQKVNATGFRIGVNKGWDSFWYAPKEQYQKLLLEDIKLRKYIRNKVKAAGVNKVKIKRTMNKVLIELNVARPGVVIGRGGSGIEELKKQLDKMVTGDLQLKVFEIKKPELKSRLIAENIANQVSRRIMPKFAAMREIENAKATGGLKGIKIWISGRIKGAEIARVEKFQWGSVPMQTLRANIDYSLVHVEVPNAGIHGIKVWVYTGEKLDLDENDF